MESFEELIDSVKKLAKSITPEQFEKDLEEYEELSKSLHGGYFNYRLIEKGDDNYKYYEIHEVYYDGNGEIWAWSENPTNLYFESIYDIKEEIRHIKDASKKTILKIVDDNIIDTKKYLKEVK